MKRHGKLWLAAIGGVALVALTAVLLDGAGRHGPALSPPPLNEAAFFEDSLAPAVTPAGYDLTIVVYSDYQCPYCRRADDALQALLKEDSRVRVVYRDWPLLGEGSAKAARAAIASQWQGKHPDFHAALMALPARLNDRTIRMAADAAAVDWARLEQDMAARRDEIDQLLARNALQAAQLGLVGTPGFLIGRFRVPGAVDLPRLRDIVRMAREDAAAQPS